MIGQEADDLARYLELGDVSVQQEPVGTVHFERDMTVQYLVDVDDLRGHAEVIAHEGRLCRPDNLGQHAAGARRRPGGGPALPPLMLMSCRVEALSFPG